MNMTLVLFRASDYALTAVGDALEGESLGRAGYECGALRA